MISVAAILNSVYPGGISGNEVVDDFIAYNSAYGTGRTYPDYQRIEELRNFINSTYFAYLNAGVPSRGSMLRQPVRTWLAQGSYAIVGVQIGGATGRVGTGNAGHWLVVTGISHQWDKPWQERGREAWESPWRWVRVYNPFQNRTEYYPWRFFGPAHGNFDYTMKVDRHSRSHTVMLLDLFREHAVWCQLPEFVRQRLK